MKKTPSTQTKRARTVPRTVEHETRSTRDEDKARNVTMSLKRGEESLKKAEPVFYETETKRQKKEREVQNNTPTLEELRVGIERLREKIGSLKPHGAHFLKTIDELKESHRGVEKELRQKIAELESKGGDRSVVSLYSELTSMEITKKSENLYEVRHVGAKKLIFNLRKEEGTYCYELISQEPSFLPSYLCEEVIFDASQLPMFYQKIVDSIKRAV